VPGFVHGVNQIDQFLRTTARGGSGAARILRAGLLQQLQPMQQQLSDAVKGIGHEAGIDELAKARAKGIVQIENADPGDAVELLAACIISAKLAETGERQDDAYTTRIVTTFVQKLSGHLSSGREYLIFDEPIANLTEAAIREGLFSPAQGPAGRSAQAMTASALMGRLPTFPNATVDEVLDIRTELAPSLTQFRAAMVTISKTFKSAAWEAHFEDEVHDAWVGSVLPAVEAIDAAAAGRNRVVKARPVVAVGQLGMRERWRLCVAAAHVLSEALDAVGVVPFDTEVLAGDEPVGALAGAGRLDVG
jgi:hypothetical protein